MKKYTITILFLITLRGLISAGEIKGHISHYPERERVSLGRVIGHSTLFIDSTRTDSAGYFYFNSQHSWEQGIYRLVFADDRFLDIIPSAEPVELYLDFEVDLLTDSLRILQSRETQYYYNVHQIEMLYSWRISKLSELLRFYLKKQLASNIIQDMVNEIHRLDRHRRSRIEQLISAFPGSFFSRWVKAAYTPLPVFTAEWMRHYDSEQAFLQDHFFDHIDFSDTTLLNSSFYRDKIEYYLQNILKPDMPSQRFGIDLVLKKSAANSRIRRYAAEFMHYYYTVHSRPDLAVYVQNHSLIKD